MTEKKAVTVLSAFVSATDKAVMLSVCVSSLVIVPVPREGTIVDPELPGVPTVRSTKNVSLSSMMASLLAVIVMVWVSEPLGVKSTAPAVEVKSPDPPAPPTAVLSFVVKLITSFVDESAAVRVTVKTNEVVVPP